MRLDSFLGIANAERVMVDFLRGYGEKLAFYPLGVPKNSLVLHNLFGTSMIGLKWFRYECNEPESKFTLLAAFNVMQHFLFQSTIENS